MRNLCTFHPDHIKAALRIFNSMLYRIVQRTPKNLFLLSLIDRLQRIARLSAGTIFHFAKHPVT